MLFIRHKSLLSLVVLLSFFFIHTTAFSQKKDKVLLSIDGTPVYISEFLTVYQKNQNIILETEQKDVDDYVDMFVDYKLKLISAYSLQLDTATAFKKELTKYREQLMIPYLKDEKATEELIRQAYERSLEEVNASHILIKLAPDASPADTLKAFNTLNTIRNRISNGTPFEQMAVEFSDDPSAKENKGNLGYFSVFDMVYPFENAAYSTSPGQISKIFRTRFGYHILKIIDKRPSKGEVEVAHIFIKTKPDDPQYAKKHITDLYNKILQGEDFAFLAKKYSDDQSSAAKGGVMRKFGAGKLIKPLDSAAFSLINPGDITKPFSSDYGWHILKLRKKIPIGTYEQNKQQLEQRIENGSRAVIIKRSLADRVKKNYKIVENQQLLQELYNGKKLKNSLNENLLSIDNKHLTVNDFLNYSRKIKNKSTREIYEDFKTEKIIEYYKEHLEETSKDFAKVMKEYKDGLILFELLQKKIWKKAGQDSLGLQQYFQDNRDKYYWKKRARVIFASCTQELKAEKVRKMMLEHKTIDEIKEKINEGATIHVLFNENMLEENSAKFPKQFILKEGVSDIYNEGQHHYSILNVLEIIPGGPKKLDETRGQVLNDYQNYLEKQWEAELHKKHTVKVNKRTLKELKKTLEK